MRDPEAVHALSIVQGCPLFQLGEKEGMGGYEASSY